MIVQMVEVELSLDEVIQEVKQSKDFISLSCLALNSLRRLAELNDSTESKQLEEWLPDSYATWKQQIKDLIEKV